MEYETNNYSNIPLNKTSRLVQLSRIRETYLDLCRIVHNTFQTKMTSRKLAVNLKNICQRRRETWKKSYKECYFKYIIYVHYKYYQCLNYRCNTF